MTLTELANNIVSKLKSNELKRSDLSTYFDYCESNLQEVQQIDNSNDSKNAATPFLIMLSNSDFTTNSYVWQTICSQAYYSISYYLQKKILDEFNVPKPEKLIEYVELLNVRLMILLNGKQYFPDLIFRIPNNPNKSKYWSPLSSSGMTDTKGFEDMVMSDAGLISKYASSPIIGAFQQEGLKFANSVISGNPNLLAKNTIEELILKGQDLHVLFFKYLDELLTREGRIDFHSDDD
jgi:hypothetical protein